MRSKIKIGTTVQLYDNDAIGKVIYSDRAKVAGKSKNLLEVELQGGSTRYAYSDNVKVINSEIE